MPKVPNQWEISAVPADDDRLELVERIVAHKRFQRAPQLREILLYVGVRSLTENSGLITEQEIGSKVLGRGPDFDPGHDNIVRAQMRHLRQKLAEYFEEDGRDEPLILTIPKGQYVARFEPRSLARAAQAPNGTDGSSQRLAGPATRERKWRIGTRLAVALVIVVACAALLWLVRSSAALAPNVPEAYSFYEEILGPIGDEAHPALSLVLGNPVVMLYAGSPSKGGEEIGATKAIPVPAEWEARLAPAVNRADAVLPYHLLQIKKGDYTGIGDATGCFHIGQLMQVLHRRTEVTQARFLSWDSARRRDLIILGSPHTNEWASGNVPDHDFRIVKLGIRNQNPKPGEPDLFPCTWDETGIPIEDYGLIWAWRTPAGSRVLVLAGPSAAATGSMAQLFCNPEEFRPLYELVKADAAGEDVPKNWQLLMRIDVRDNLPVHTEYVTHRVYSPKP